MQCIHPPPAIHFPITLYMNGCVPLSHSRAGWQHSPSRGVWRRSGRPRGHANTKTVVIADGRPVRVNISDERLLRDNPRPAHALRLSSIRAIVG